VEGPVRRVALECQVGRDVVFPVDIIALESLKHDLGGTLREKEGTASASPQLCLLSNYIVTVSPSGVSIK